MNIQTQIAAHLNARAEVRAKEHAVKATQLISQEVVNGELAVSTGVGGSVTVNAAFVESLQGAIAIASLERFQKEETGKFYADAEELLAERAKDKKK